MSSLGRERLFNLALYIVSANRKKFTLNTIMLLFYLGEFEFRSLSGAAFFRRHCFNPEKFQTNSTASVKHELTC